MAEQPALIVIAASADNSARNPEARGKTPDRVRDAATGYRPYRRKVATEWENVGVDLAQYAIQIPNCDLLLRKELQNAKFK